MAVYGLFAMSTLSLASDRMDPIFDEAPPSAGRKIPINFASLDVGFGVKLADLTFFEGLNLSGRYKYQVEPSYQGGYFTRIDSYEVKLGISQGAFFKEEDLPLYLKFEGGPRIISVLSFQGHLAPWASVPVFDLRTFLLIPR